MVRSALRSPCCFSGSPMSISSGLTAPDPEPAPFLSSGFISISPASPLPLACASAVPAIAATAKINTVDPRCARIARIFITRAFLRAQANGARLETARAVCTLRLRNLGAAGVTVQRLDKRVGVKRAQMADLLSDSDESHRHLQLVTDAQYDSAFRRAIELCEDDAGDLHVGLERLGL